LSTHRGWLVYIAFTITLGVGALQVAQASDAAEAEALVTKARLALENFQRDPEMASLRRLANRAWAMFIMPQLLKGGFIVGGSGGNGVLVARVLHGGRHQFRLASRGRTL
jgi:lipid-binding SYLF domain-containing protein